MTKEFTVPGGRSLLALAFALAFSLAACGGDDPGFEIVEIPSGEPVVIGVSTMLEGELASTGTALRDAATLAGEGVTIAGHEVEFVATDDGCTVDGGGVAAEELVATDHLVGVVGPSCSDAVLGSQPVFEEAGITHISQLSTNIAMTDPEDREPYPTFLRTAFNDRIQGQQQAAFAERLLGADSAFIVYEAFRYGGASDTFRTSFPGELVGDVGFEDEGEFPDIVSQITEANPDLVYFAGFYPTGIPFVEALRGGGYGGPVLAGDAMYDQKLIDGLGELAEQELYVTLPSPPLGGQEFEDFDSRYQEAYGADPTTTPFSAESFDAARAIILGLQADGVVEETDGGIEVDLGTLNDAIREVAFDGASGPVRFDDSGDRVAEGLTPVTVFVVRDGAFVPVNES
ncbi:MAG TPA: branched-chain amino acid ABC transporter substrate-binding protein [Actinomycetota bacterium]|nr:branched-chain amino acid ABC transporter substrate-binding protein [Actinomycetota bacterium]